MWPSMLAHGKMSVMTSASLSYCTDCARCTLKLCRCCAQVINSVIMDDVVLGDHAHIQNTIVCRGSILHDRCSLRDCQVSPLGQ